MAGSSSSDPVDSGAGPASSPDPPTEATSSSSRDTDGASGGRLGAAVAGTAADDPLKMPNFGVITMANVLGTHVDGVLFAFVTTTNVPGTHVEGVLFAFR